MGKRRSTPGTGQLGLEIDAELLTTWKAFVKDRKETLREAAERAFIRDMANPPPPPVYPPLPPVPAPGEKPTKGKPKK
jgi:hypothetical protein